MSHYFITATDTDAGKTFISANLLKSAARLGKKCFGFKPVASGCEQTLEGLRNEDAVSLQQAGSIALSYEQVNLYQFVPAIAPHIAARQAGVKIDLLKSIQHYHGLIQKFKPDFSLVEGVGGWQVPLDDNIAIPDLAKQLDLAVVVVVKIKLGCINHALLTLNAIRSRGVPLKGWIANAVVEDEICRANVQAIQERTEVPLLGKVSLHNMDVPDNSLMENEFNSLFSKL